MSEAVASAPAGTNVLQCPICGGAEARRVWRERGVELLRCLGCGHVRSTWQAGPDYAGYWGDSAVSENSLAAHSDYWYRARVPVYREFLRRFSAYCGRLLDVGCGIGFFVKVARDAGWDAHGSEVSPVAVRIGREQLGLAQLHVGRVEDAGFVQGSFDAITLWDVIEHVPDPVSLLIELRRLLRPGGLLFVQTPNVNMQLLRARVVRCMRGKDEGCNTLEVKDHLNDFTPGSLRLAVQRAGYAHSRVFVLLPTFSLAGGRGRFGVAAKLGWYGLARGVFVLSGRRLHISNTIHLAAWA